MKHVLIVDDYPSIRKSLTQLLENTGNYSVLQAEDGYEALAHRELYDNIELILMDIEMPGMNGAEATRSIIEKFPDTKILILTGHYTRELVLELLEAGAMGYILKDIEKEELVHAIQTVIEGGYYFGNRPMSLIMNELKEDLLKRVQTPESQKISEREKEIIQFVSEGLTNKEIASKLFLSKRTIDNTRQKIMDKLDVKNSAQLICYAVKNRLIA